jgi:type II secretory pathway pseudopilin PulG
MQRKNSFLKKFRGGMAMIMAIAVIVIIATIMALALSLTSQTTKRTVDIYLYEQSALYAKSAVELALLEIAGATPCSISHYDTDFNGSIYDANITFKYIYTNASSICASGIDYFDINTSEQNGSVLMDISVGTDAGTEPIRYFRRSIQKL